jgi:mRNA interferase MazF
LIISQGVIGQDVILAGISSVVRGGGVSPTDYLVDATHPEFPVTGLRVSSVVRLHKLTTVLASILIRRLGRVGSRMHSESVSYENGRSVCGRC